MRSYTAFEAGIPSDRVKRLRKEKPGNANGFRRRMKDVTVHSGFLS